jgi:DNA-directed RNA polymerase subunit beta'
MSVSSVGHFLLNDVLPDAYKITGPVTNKQLHNHLVSLAKTEPKLYADTISKLKKRGDEIATYEGVSVGLDDITPQYATRDKILNVASQKLDAAKSLEEKQRAILDAQTQLLNHTVQHPGSMTQMATSGARGNPAQLMKIIASPLAANDNRPNITPFLIRHSYSEGLTPAEFWTTTPEARANNVASVVSVSKPGELNKVLIANMISKVITVHDCGTHTGIHLPVDNPHTLDRYTASDQQGTPRNTLVTPPVLQTLKSRGIHDIYVRSPMTCAATHGVCQLCYGLDERGHAPTIGTSIGVRSSQALTEPLTQMALSSKHSVLTIKERKLEPTGLKGVRQLLEIPQAFQHEAVLAPILGMIDSVKPAPQGGNYIHLGNHQLYATPELTVTVKPGQHVEAGDVLTNGVPHPAKIVQLKGIGAGREHFVNALSHVYKGEGVDMDRRHFELLARTNMNTVRLVDHDPNHPEFLKGDPINYNSFRDAYMKDGIAVPLDKSVGQRLAKEVFHHTVGTTITPSLIQTFRAHGLNEVHVAPNMPRVEFVMRNFAMSPMMDTDWMGRLAHRYLKGSLLQAAQFSEESDIHGYHPVPAYAYGAEFRQGPEGRF